MHYCNILISYQRNHFPFISLCTVQLSVVHPILLLYHYFLYAWVLCEPSTEQRNLYQFNMNFSSGHDSDPNCKDCHHFRKLYLNITHSFSFQSSSYPSLYLSVLLEISLSSSHYIVTQIIKMCSLFKHWCQFVFGLFL